MTAGAQKILEQALALPDEDRRRLAEALLASTSAPDESAQQEWLEVARARAGELERGEVTAIPAQEALDAVRRSLTEKTLG